MARRMRFTINLPVKIIAALLVLIFLHYSGALLPLENVVVRLSGPIQHGLYRSGVAINRFLRPGTDISDEAAKIEELGNQIQRLTLENSQLKVLLDEYGQVNEQFDFIKSSGFEAVSAKVIGKTFSTDTQVIFINQGRRAGIEPGLPVIAQGGSIIGKVFEVNDNNSKVLLINDNQSRLAAHIQNNVSSKGLVVGERGLSMIMDLIPQNEVVEVGNVVITSGLEVAVPSGLVIGVIDRVDSEPNSFFQKAFIQSLVNFDDLTVVSVLVNPI